MMDNVTKALLSRFFIEILIESLAFSKISKSLKSNVLINFDVQILVHGVL